MDEQLEHLASTARRLRVDDGCLVIPVELISTYSVGFDANANEVGVGLMTFRLRLNHHREIVQACSERGHTVRPFTLKAT